MSKKVNSSKKGTTNVKSKKTGVSRKRNRKDWVDAKTAAVTRDEKVWNDFQLMGDTNAEEMNYESKPQVSGKKLEKVLNRAKAMRVGRMVQLAYEYKEFDLA